MVEEARIRIVVDPRQARRAIDGIEGRPGIEAQAAGAKEPTDTQDAAASGTQGGKKSKINLSLEAGRVAVARKFGTNITRVATFGVAVAGIFGLLIPIIQTAIEETLDETLEGDPFSEKVNDIIKGTLGSVTETVQRIGAEAAGVILSVGESMSLAKGFALTGQEFDGRFFSSIGAIDRVNAMQTKAKFDLSEAGLIQTTRNALASAREVFMENLRESMRKGQ